MNVMQNDQLFQPARGQNETRLRRELDLPPPLPKHRTKLEIIVELNFACIY